MRREILHVDMNSFYASAELIDRPELADRPVAVGGNAEERHGIILAKNIIAKSYGVKTGEPIWQSKGKCPDLVVIPPDYEKYLYYSRRAQEIYYEYTNFVEPFGMDECWLDVTGSRWLFGDGVQIGNEIRKRIKKELNLTVSVGVSFNKVFAKIGSDYRKPDALTYISQDNFKNIVWPLDIQEMIMIGRKTKNKLNKIGIYKIGDLANTDAGILKNLLGINGLKIWNWANGRDYSEVADYNYRAPVKSIGHGITLSENLVSDYEVRNVFLKLAQKVSARLIDYNLMAKGVQIDIRDEDLKHTIAQGQLIYSTYSSLEMTDLAMKLFADRYVWDREVRSLSIRAIDLQSSDICFQADLFNDAHIHEKKIKVEKTVKKIRDRYGEEAVSYADLMGNLKMPSDGRDMIIMPNSFI